MEKNKNNAGLGLTILGTIGAIVFVIFFYFWISNYFESVGNTTKFEDNFAPVINKIENNRLYFRSIATNNITVNKIELNGVICSENDVFKSGDNNIDISPCTINLGAGKYEIIFFTSQAEHKSFIFFEP